MSALDADKRTARDFDFLDGDFDVEGERLNDPQRPDSGWRDVPATAHADLWLDGLVSIDEMWFPGDECFGLSLRTYDLTTGNWAVRWVNSRGGGLQPPVRGDWRDGSCFLTGAEEYRGSPIEVSYAWSEAGSAAPRWEQCFSFDGGQSWQPNWRMTYRPRARPVEHPELPRLAGDFDFLVGDWDVDHVRARDPMALALGKGSDFEEFTAPYRSTTYLAGAVSVDECDLGRRGARGLVFRVFDTAAERWSIYWVNSAVGTLEPPVHGSFEGGVGTFDGEENLGNRDVRVQFRWTDVDSLTPSWEQRFSVDGGQRWTTNWTMLFRRPGS